MKALCNTVNRKEVAQKTTFEKASDKRCVAEKCSNVATVDRLCGDHELMSRVTSPRLIKKLCACCDLAKVKLGELFCKGCNNLKKIIQVNFHHDEILTFDDIIEKIKLLLQLYLTRKIYVGVTKHPIQRDLEHIYSKNLNPSRFSFYTLFQGEDSVQLGDYEHRLLNFLLEHP